MPFSEARVAGNRVLVHSPLCLPVAELAVQLAQVELRRVAALVQLDFPAVLGDRRFDVIPLLGDQRQVDMRERQI